MHLSTPPSCFQKPYLCCTLNRYMDRAFCPSSEFFICIFSSVFIKHADAYPGAANRAVQPGTVGAVLHSIAHVRPEKGTTANKYNWCQLPSLFLCLNVHYLGLLRHHHISYCLTWTWELGGALQALHCLLVDVLQATMPT